MKTKSTTEELLRNNKGIIAGSIVLLMALGYTGQVGFYISLVVMFIIHKLRRTTIEELGLSRPSLWCKAILVSIVFSVVILAIVTGLEPLIKMVADEPADISRFDMIRENVWILAGVIVSVWVSAAFGEEIIWRGYIMKNLAEIFGNDRKAWVASLVLSSVAFGLLHHYQGVTGMIQTGLVGLLLGVVYIRNSKRSLWVNVLIHGLIDTTGMIYIYATG